MLKPILLALAIVTMLISGEQFIRRAQATVICGNAGCAPVQVKKMQKHQMPTSVPSSVPAKPAS